MHRAAPATPVKTVMKKRRRIPRATKLRKVSPVHTAAAIFLTYGAQAAHDYFANPLRAKLLMPRIMARAKYLVRCTKRAVPEAFTQPERPQLPTSL